ncbi:hypothetical protein XELAEV_18026539mg [Xenopus laevis]|uniref:Uncharacterized protein n=1 Tax=Xenopus laevis TaxID=8355 RepID=A0A974HIX8_XENLA|nr:hypothetical protein XELAEV_18026539mg [Xenopus laevis]
MCKSPKTHSGRKHSLIYYLSLTRHKKLNMQLLSAPSVKKKQHRLNKPFQSYLLTSSPKEKQLQVIQL